MMATLLKVGFVLKMILYHKTKKDPVIDTYFGTKIIDNYRWLEDDLSKETESWVVEQNKTTNGFLNNIPFREFHKVVNLDFKFMELRKNFSPF